MTKVHFVAPFCPVKTPNAHANAAAGSGGGGDGDDGDDGDGGGCCDCASTVSEAKLEVELSLSLSSSSSSPLSSLSPLSLPPRGGPNAAAATASGARSGGKAAERGRGGEERFTFC